MHGLRDFRQAPGYLATVFKEATHAVTQTSNLLDHPSVDRKCDTKMLA